MSEDVKMYILHNRIQCKKCGDILESKNVHDFKMCSCRSCAVDGGHDYLRRVGEPSNWVDMSISIPLDEAIERGYVRIRTEEDKQRDKETAMKILEALLQKDDEFKKEYDGLFDSIADG